MLRQATRRSKALQPVAPPSLIAKDQSPAELDNVVRPFLVGRDACMPDYVVLVATLGAFKLSGLSGLAMRSVIATLHMGAWEFLAMWNRLLPDTDFSSVLQ